MFTLGWAWLASLIGPLQAFTSGVAPFLLGDLLKVFGTAVTIVGVQRLRDRLQR